MTTIHGPVVRHLNAQVIVKVHTARRHGRPRNRGKVYKVRTWLAARAGIAGGERRVLGPRSRLYVSE